MKNMLLHKKAGPIALIVSLLLTSVPPAGAVKEGAKEKQTTIPHVNLSKQVKSEIRSEVDLAAISKKVKEKSVQTEPAVTERTITTEAVEADTTSTTPYADKIDEAPFQVSSETENISTLSGGLSVRVTDMVVKGRNGLDFELARVYDNNNAQLWGMGDKWDSQYGSYPVSVPDTFLRQHYSIGTGWSFELPAFEKDDHNSGSSRSSISQRLRFGGGIYKIPNPTSRYAANLYALGYPWKDMMWYPDAGTVDVGGRKASCFLDATKEARIYYFDATGHLLQISDAHGNFIKFYYAANPQYNGALLSKVETSIGNSMTVQYLPGQVVVTQGSKQVIYKKQIAPGTTDRELLTEVIDAGGRRTVYDYAIKKARFNQFPYSWNDQFNQNPYALLTGVTHPTGAKSVYQYEETPVVRYIYERDNIYSNIDQYRLASVEKRMFRSDGTVDVRDRKLLTYYGDMGLQYGYRPAFYTTIDNGNSKVAYNYNKDYQQTSIVQTVGDLKKTIHFGYNNSSMDLVPQPTIYVSPLPVVTLVNYEKNNFKTDLLLGSSWKYYDDYGNVMQTDDAHGYVVPYHIIQKYKYDPVYHRLISAEEPLSTTETRKTEYLRNAQGDVTQMTVKDQTGALLKQENYEYDAYGNRTVARLQDNGRVIVTATEYGAAYQSAYPTKQTTQVTDANGTVSTLSNQFEYDMTTGQVTRATDGNGNATTYQYDVLGRLVKQTNPDQSIVSWKFDDLGNRIESTDENGGKTYSQWNPLGWKVEAGFVLGGVDVAKEKVGYDATGRKVWTEDALGNRTTFTYDGMDRLTQMTYADGSKATVQYDNIKNTITTTDADGTVVRETYDRFDETARVVQKELLKPTGAQLLQAFTYDFEKDVTSEKDAKGNLKQYKYDVLNRLVSVTDPQGKQTQYAYDMAGNVTQITHPDGQSIRKQYDELGRLQRQTDARGQEQTYFYDANDNLTEHVDRKGQVLTIAYNERNFLLQKSAGTEIVSYEYDATGKRTAMTDGTGKTAYAYWPTGEIESVQLPDGKTLSYEYDAAGNRTKMKDPFGRGIYYAMDKLNRIESVSLDAPGAPAEAVYTYTPGGLLQAERLGNGMRVESSFNELKKTKTLIQKQADGAVENSYAYDYDLNGNQTWTTENGSGTQFTYDPLDRILSSTQFNESYAYDHRGNRKTLQSDQVPSLSDSTYEYDAWNHLAKITLGDGKTVSYKYNGDGLLYERTEDGETTRFYYDGDQMIAEADVSGDDSVMKARYVRGIGLVLQEDASGRKAYYMHNAHGDVTELRDGSGALLNQYAYDIWGNPLTVTEQVNNPFRYSGEYWDGTVALQYLRARWYEPSIGRFISEDTYQGEIENPASLNWYAYVSNNPLRYTDPTGHWQKGDELMSASAQSEIRYWTTQWTSANRKNDSVSKQKAAAAANLVRSNFWSSRGSQIAGKMVPDPNGSFIAGYTSVLGGERGGIRIGNRVTAILSVIGAVIVGEGLGSNKTPTTIFRSGSKTNNNLTPRKQDTNGLSFNLVPAGKYVYTTVEAVNATGVLRAVVDGKNHASVRAADPAQHLEWINSKANAETDPYYLTVLLQSLVVRGR